MAPQHIGNWGQTLVEDLRRQGVSDQALVGNSGINIRSLDGDEPVISFADLAQLFERAAKVTNDDLVGLKHGQNCDYRRGGLIAYAGITSPTVCHLLENLERYQRITGDALNVNTIALEQDGIVEWHFTVPRGVIRKQYVEFSASLLLNIIRRQTNRRITPLKLEFRHFRKTNTKPFSVYFGCPVSFGANENRVRFKTDDLALPLESADDRLFVILKKFCEDTLKKHRSDKTSLVVSVEKAIASDPSQSQDQVATELGMSARTLARRLTESGTTFFGIVEAYREAMAKNMLADSTFQITEIAFVLGYSDASSFSTAFKRWTAKTPTEYRDQNSK